MTSLTNDTKSSGIWLKSASSLSMSLISDSLSFSIDSIPPELRGDPYALRHSFTLDPSTMDEQKAYHCYGLEQDGALRPGGQISLFTRRTIGLLLNYFAIGAMFGGMNSAIVPFLRKYLLLEQYQVKDSLRICRYKRKPYLILGWVLCITCLLYLAASGVPEVGNSREAWRYVLLMTIGTIGYFLASVAADGMMVEVAQREPLMTRGHTQMSISVARTAGSLFMSLFVSGTLNGLEYGGSFSWSLSLNQIMFAFAAFALIPLVGSIWCLHEDFAVQRALVFSCSDIVSCSAAPPNTTSLNPPLNFSNRCQLVWRLIRSRIMWQLLVFELISSFCLTINSSAKPAIEEIWIGVGAWPNALGTAVWSVAFIGGLFMTRCFFMHSGWRRLYCAAILWMVGVDVVMVTCTIFDVMRNCNFWMYMQVLAAPAVGMRFLVQILPIIELAPRGIEGTAYGLVITFRYIAIPLGTTTFKVIGSYFSISDEDVHRDSDSTRLQIAYTYLIAWAFQLMSLAFIGLFPCQKLAIQHLRYHGGYSTLAGWLVVIVMFCALIYATTVSILLLSKSTSCLRMAGGSGC